MRRTAWLALAGTLWACAADAAPKATPDAPGVCPLRTSSWPSQIDVFDGEPSGEVILAPDDDGAGANTCTVKQIYAQGRAVTTRCHYGKESVDVKIATPVSACHCSGDDKHPQIACR